MAVQGNDQPEFLKVGSKLAENPPKAGIAIEAGLAT